ncbi:MAG: hypothetical protein HEQ35_30975 [Gloeotrichia echinulata IR180]
MEPLNNDIKGNGDTSASSVHRWGHFGKLSASLGTLRQAQCIAGDWGVLPMTNDK